MKKDRRKTLLSHHYSSKSWLLLLIFLTGTELVHAIRESCPNNEICLNDGQCYLNRSQDRVEFECECKDGFEGDLCERAVQQIPGTQPLPNPAPQPPLNSCPLECQNGGRCILNNISSQPQCECAQGFTGELCSQASDCRSRGCSEPNQVCLYDLPTARFVCEEDECALKDPCSNNATCRPSKNDFFCECPQGLRGKLCEEDIDECQQNSAIPPCRNGGVCKNLLGSYRCSCASGFAGEICEQSIGFCHQNPCMNKGVCQELDGSYACHCFANITGRNCETELASKLSCDAFHQLVINADGGTPECLCREGMTGDKCDVHIDLCEGFDGCQNGGQCISNVNRIFCICPSKFIGHFCELAVGDCTVDGRPCLNNGLCAWDDANNSTTCKCSPRFKGKWCDQKRLDVVLPSSAVIPNDELEMPCPQGFCQNGGTCFRRISSQLSSFSTNKSLTEQFSCMCPPHTQGPNCELAGEPAKPKDPCKFNTCSNGGKCRYSQESEEKFTCDCPPGFLGRICEIECNCNEGLSCRESQTGKADCYKVFVKPPAGSSLPTDTIPTDTNNHEEDDSILSTFPQPPPVEIPLTTTSSRLTQDHDSFGSVTQSVDSLFGAKTNMNQTITSCRECVNAEKCLVMEGQGVVCLCSTGFSGPFCDLKRSACSSFNCTTPGEICSLRRELPPNNNKDTPYCSCPTGTSGVGCRQPTIASFSNSSIFLTQNFQESTGTEYSVKFSFRTTLPHVHFVSGESLLDKQEFSIGLKEGRLSLNLSESIQIPDLSALPLNDDDWYTIQLENRLVEGTSIEVSHSQTGYVLAKRRLGALKYTSIFMTRFGRKAENVHFVGCLRDVQIDNRTIDLLNTERSIDVVPGCVRQQQCSNETCQNGAKCLDLWSSSRCECIRPFIGSKCEIKISEATFGHSNQSLVEYSLNTKDAALIHMTTELSFLVRTKAKRAILFYLGDRSHDDDLGTFISAEVDDGFLRVNSRLGGKQVYSNRSLSRINDNHPHLVEISRHQNDIQVKVDGNSEPGITIQRPFAHPLLADRLIIGSHTSDVRPEALREAAEAPFFKGTLQDMRMNEHLVAFTDSPFSPEFARFGDRQSEQNLLPGTVSDDVCTQLRPCGENGVCSNTFNDFECNCRTGWIGELCNQKDFCGSNSPCPMGTQCVNSNGGYVCTSTSTFAPTSSIKYAIHLPLHYAPLKQTNLSFEIRTRSEQGAVMKLQSTLESLSVELRDGQLIFTFKNQSSSDSATPFGMKRPFNDGQWHFLSIVDRAQQLSVCLDNTSSIPLPLSFSLKRFVLDRHAQIAFGKTLNNPSFKGCLRDAKFGSLPPFSFLDNKGNKNQSSDSLIDAVHFAVASRQNIRHDGCHSSEVCGRMNQCTNGAACSDKFNMRKCECSQGFEGEFCEVNTDDCKKVGNMCGPNGICVDGLLGDFRCQCAEGFTGIRCDVSEDKCQQSPCLNGGKCQTVDGEYRCACSEHFIGRHCQIETRAVKCSEDPCQNGGKCVETEMGSIKCICRDDRFGGDLCDVPKNYCKDFPCYGGTCQPTVGSTSNFTCKCPDKYEGDRCEHFIDVCSKERPCMHEGKCQNIFGGYLCECKEGWGGAKCDVDVDECSENSPCENNGLCTNTPGSYQCECAKYYLGDRCEVAGICAHDPCLNEGECDQLSATEHNCNCKKGFQGMLCEEQINYCVHEPCRNGATCIPKIGSFDCLCIAGFSGKTCEADIDDCVSNLCSNNGTCVDRVNGFECNCAETGFKGPQCLDDVDECLEPEMNCVHGRCVNLPGAYRCDCHKGFIGSKCNMVNPCLPNAQNRTLHNCAHGKCVNPSVAKQYSGREVTQHECECDKGYAGPMCTVLMQASKSVALGYILGPITVLLIVLCVFGTMLFLFVARKKRANQGTYSPSTQEMTGTRVQVRSDQNNKKAHGFQAGF